MYKTEQFPAAGLAPGDKIVSRWSRKVITIVRWLGEGANGCVYLVRIPGKPSHCALKIGSDAYSLQSEMNALQAVGQDVPELLLADDANIRGEWLPFYAMTFVQGSALSKLLPSSSKFTHSQLHYIGEHLLARLEALHEKGWAFGDLKPDNIIVGKNGSVQLVDYGGVSRFGASVKQMTELYDRGYWRAGGRKADGAYDLFAFAVVMLEAAGLGGRIRSAAAAAKRSPAALIDLVHESRQLAPAAFLLRRMLRSEYTSAGSALRDWRGAAAGSKRTAFAWRHWPAVWFAAALVSFAYVLWRAVA